MEKTTQQAVNVRSRIQYVKCTVNQLLEQKMCLNEKSLRRNVKLAIMLSKFVWKFYFRLETDKLNTNNGTTFLKYLALMHESH